jgi:hypothetical protein
VIALVIFELDVDPDADVTVSDAAQHLRDAWPDMAGVTGRHIHLAAREAAVRVLAALDSDGAS